MGTKTVLLADKKTPFYFITIPYDGIIDPSATGTLNLTLKAGFSGTTSTPSIRINNTLIAAANNDWVYDGQDDLFRQTGSADHLQMGVWSNVTSGVISYYNGYLNDKFDQLMCYLVYDNAGTAFVSIKMKYGNWTAVDDVVDTTNERFVIHHGTTFYNTIYQVKNDITVSLGYNPSNIAVGTRLYNYKYVAPEPYGPGGTSEPTIIQTGDFDDTSDPIDFPPVPTVNALNCNFITLYTPTLTQIQALATYLWGSGFNVNDLKKILNNPMDVILGLSIVPVEVPHADTPSEIGLGNIVSTGCYMFRATQQYVDVDCGTLNLNEFWGAYLDYEPYTKISIYLPYIGYRPMSIDDCMNTAIHVKYRVDVLTGACIAMIKCNDHILYEHAGACSVSIPITATDWTNVINGIISSVVSTAGIIAGTVTGAAPLTAASAMAAVSSAAQNTMQMKPIVDRSGTISSSVGFLGVQKPYLILTRPRQALPAEQNTFTGYPSWITAKLGDLTGFTQVAEIHLQNITCTDAEKDMIEAALKEGVIL